MKITLSIATAILLSLNVATASVLISSFGTSLENDDLQGSWVGNYNSTTSTVTANDGPGSGISDFTSISIGNLAGQSQFSLTASVAGTNPATDFQISLEDSGGRVASASFNWSPFLASPTTISAPISFESGFLTNSVTGWSLTTGGTGNPLNVTFTTLTAIPEPNTWILIGIGLAAIVILRRRRTA